MEFNRNIFRANVFFGTVLAVGALASFSGCGDNQELKTTKFLAHCPGDQNVSLSKINDHRTDIICTDDGTAPRIIPMGEEFSGIDPQELINKVVLNYPGRVMVELKTDIDGENITIDSNTGFKIEDNSYSPSSITMENPVEQMSTYAPNLLD